MSSPTKKYLEKDKPTDSISEEKLCRSAKPWIVPIPGTPKLNRLEENIGAAEIELTPDDLREMNSAASKITVQGTRYPEQLQKRVGR